MKPKKFALVTGSTKGIGKQIAIDLLKKGCYVILNYSSSDSDAESAAFDLSKISSEFSIVKANMATLDGLDSLIESVNKITNTLDYIILNTGTTKRDSFKEITFEDWNQIFNTNLTIPFFLVQRLEGCLQDNGRIIFTGSVLGLIPHAMSIPYGVSKSALVMLAKYLVNVFSHRNITANVVAPGFVETPWQKDKDPAHRKRIEEKIALKRFGTVDEVSKTIMHLIDNGYITGQLLVVDGGYNYP